MRRFFSCLFHGMVMETHVESLTGPFLYSDFATGRAEKNPVLNKIAKIPLIGVLGGLARVVLGIVHTCGHLGAAAFTVKRGHLFHAAKGSCELLRGVIEALPVIGRLFAYLYCSAPLFDHTGQGRCSWWIIKIYNPRHPDGVDIWMEYWKEYPAYRYIKD